MGNVGRRNFFKQMAAAVAGAVAVAEALDPEKLLWVPGAKTIFIPEELAVRPSLAQTLAVNEARRTQEKIFDSIYERALARRAMSKNLARGYLPGDSRYVLAVSGHGENAIIEFDDGWNARRGFNFLKNADLTPAELARISSQLQEVELRRNQGVRGAAVGGRRFFTQAERFVGEERGHWPVSPLADAESRPGEFAAYSGRERILSNFSKG